MLKHPLITAILAVVFCLAGHYFMTVYIDYNVSYKKLELFRGQERFIKNQLDLLEDNKKVVQQVNLFIDQAKALGLTQDQWDKFFVTLKEEPLLFSKLKPLLSQTSGSDQYYFKPDSLVIRIKGVTAESPVQNLSEETPQLPKADDPVVQKADPDADVTVSLSGHFLVKHRGPDG